MRVDELIAATKVVLGQKAVTEFDEPIELASGQMSKFFVDGKAGLAEAADLKLACETLHAMVVDAGLDYDAVGGLTLGADHLAVGTALAGGRQWFFVRKEPKGRGTGKQIEGAKVGPGTKVVVVEDVVSTGTSMFKAIDVLIDAGAEIVAACTLLDRGGHAEPLLAERGIPYFAIASYSDFGMPQVSAA
jgi:orotate phosphoribosyltransferase